MRKLIYFLMSIQEKVLLYRLSKTVGIKQKSKRKKHFSDGCLLTLDTLADSEKTRIEEEMMLILKSANYEPKEVLEYIKKHDTEVFYIDKLKQLNSIGEVEGFIYPHKGTKALYLSFLVGKGFNLNTKEMFILPNGEIEKYTFMYHFYNWYAFKHNIEGLDTESQELLKKYLYNNTESDFKELQLSDIYKLKDAITQDKNAIEFVLNLCKKAEAAKKALDKIQDGGASI